MIIFALIFIIFYSCSFAVYSPSCDLSKEEYSYAVPRNGHIIKNLIIFITPWVSVHLI